MDNGYMDTMSDDELDQPAVMPPNRGVPPRRALPVEMEQLINEGALDHLHAKGLPSPASSPESEFTDLVDGVLDVDSLPDTLPVLTRSNELSNLASSRSSDSGDVQLLVSNSRSSYTISDLEQDLEADRFDCSNSGRVRALFEELMGALEYPNLSNRDREYYMHMFYSLRRACFPEISPLQ